MKRLKVKIKEKNLEPSFDDFMQDIKSYMKSKYGFSTIYDTREVIFITSVLYAHFDIETFHDLHKEFLKNPNFSVTEDIDIAIVQLLLEAILNYQQSATILN